MEQEPLKALTLRQRELLDLVADGIRTSKALAHRTGLAVGTIDNLLQQAAKTLGVSGREAAARRYHVLKENSHDASHVRISPLLSARHSLLSPNAGAIRWIVGGLASFFRGPPLGGQEHKLRWHQITLHILWVAVIAMVAISAIVLLVLGFYQTFS